MGPTVAVIVAADVTFVKGDTGVALPAQTN